MSREGESFLLVLDTYSPNVVSTANTNCTVQFNVNWATVIPTNKYKKFKCRVAFKSEMQINSSSNLISPPQICNGVGLISVDFGRKNIYGCNQSLQTIGFIYPIVNVLLTFTTNIYGQSYYSSNYNDNIDFYCDYPVNNLFTVNLINSPNQVTATPYMSYMKPWKMFINFTGIIEDE